MNKVFMIKTTQASPTTIASIAKAIAHPARVAIIAFLAQQESCVCKDIVEEIGLAQSTISQHLLELKKAGLIKGVVSGRNTCYCLHIENWNTAADILFAFMKLPLKTPLNPCC